MAYVLVTWAQAACHIPRATADNITSGPRHTTLTRRGSTAQARLPSSDLGFHSYKTCLELVMVTAAYLGLQITDINKQVVPIPTPAVARHAGMAAVAPTSVVVA